MNITVHLDGSARILTRRKEVVLSIAPNATWRDVIAALASAAPALVGEFITFDKRDLVGTLNRSGKQSISDLDAKVDLSEDDFLMILEDAC